MYNRRGSKTHIGRDFEIEEFLDLLFENFDPECTGTIDGCEFHNFVDKMTEGFKGMGKVDKTETFKMADKDGSNTIDRRELQHWLE